MDIQQLEELYIRAKAAYYEGESIMTDDEFDRLEEELKELGSEVVEIVGNPIDRNAKFPHWSQMGSLSKVQASLDGTLPIEQMNKWFDSFPEEVIFEATPKFDGNAVNLMYKRGKLERCVSRGNGIKGRDITQKLVGKIPNDLGVHYDVEIRAEVVMPISIFQAKYASESKNARNFVAGVLNRIENDPEVLSELEILAIEARVYRDITGDASSDYDYPLNSMELIKSWGFLPSKTIYFKKDEFERVYQEMKNYRENESPYLLDGMVVKAQEDIRKTIGYTGHHPSWAIAVKFPPKEAVTKILGFKWNVGTSGEISPIANFEPVDLDGTVVKNAAAFNYGHIVREQLYPGAEVTVAKAGDIIPQIYKVIKKGDPSSFIYPTHCPKCNTETVIDGIHLMCPNEECEGKLYRKFLIGIRTFQTKRFGGVTVKNLYDAGYTRVHDVFDIEKFNEEKLIATGKFSKGKTLEYLIAEIENIKSVPLHRCILSLQFDKVGISAAKQIAKMIRGQKYSFSGLVGTAIQGWNPGENRREKLEELLRLMEARGIVIENEPDEIAGIGYEMTGSPKGSGFDTKSELEKFLSNYGYVHKGLKESKILLTDSMNSSSSKMAMARKLGIEIKTYSDFINSLKNEQIN
jgi:DNA ligase (NAD+)